MVKNTDSGDIGVINPFTNRFPVNGVYVIVGRSVNFTELPNSRLSPWIAFGEDNCPPMLPPLSRE
jgi:hypothetical protein